jgi:hypothetical protein
MMITGAVSWPSVRSDGSKSRQLAPHRLTVAERSEHIAEWVRLTEEGHRRVAQVALVSSKDERLAVHQH